MRWKLLFAFMVICLLWPTQAQAVYSWKVLGGSPLWAEGVHSPSELQGVVQNSDFKQRNLSGFSKAEPSWNSEEAFEIYKAEVLRGNIVEIAHPPGKMFKWMLFYSQKKKETKIALDTQWSGGPSGSEPIHGFATQFYYKGKSVIFFIAEKCANLCRDLEIVVSEEVPGYIEESEELIERTVIERTPIIIKCPPSPPRPQRVIISSPPPPPPPRVIVRPHPNHYLRRQQRGIDFNYWGGHGGGYAPLQNRAPRISLDIGMSKSHRKVVGPSLPKRPRLSPLPKKPPPPSLPKKRICPTSGRQARPGGR